MILKTVKVQDILEVHPIEPGAVFMAADNDDNNALTVTDLSTINNAILGTIRLIYNAIINN